MLTVVVFSPILLCMCARLMSALCRKVLEIDFVPGECSSPRGLRALTRVQLDELCTAARCTIIATMSNDHLDSYVLSGELHATIRAH